MEYAQNIDGRIAYCIHHDIRNAADEPFTRAGYPAWSTHLGKMAKHFERRSNPATDGASGAGIIRSDK